MAQITNAKTTSSAIDTICACWTMERTPGSLGPLACIAPSSPPLSARPAVVASKGGSA